VWLMGPYHPDTVSAANNLAVVLYECKELARARDLQNRVLDSSIAKLGKEHPHTLGQLLAAKLLGRETLA
jgi:hypothetical protein